MRSVGAPEFTSEKADVFFEELFEMVGLSASAYRDTALKRRIPACLRFLRTSDLEAARLKLKQNTKLTAEALNVILLGVTEFCRDRTVFDQLRELVLPGLSQLAQPLRIWSAACSDGRELYSISILLNEAGLNGFELLGTDCRPEAIESAQQGLFPMESLDKLEPAWKNHFIRVHNKAQVAGHLKKKSALAAIGSADRHSPRTMGHDSLAEHGNLPQARGCRKDLTWPH